MSQVMHGFEFITPVQQLFTAGDAVAVSGGYYRVIVGQELKEEKPVEIVNGKIEINENMIKKNQIESVIFNGQTYYVRKKDGAIEVFQLEE